MENDTEKEKGERRNSNTEYLPTKCRITKPPPPKPATNPLQFIKVAPCPLFQKAKEQIKKVEEIKRERKDITDEVEDWQANLDNWKSSRRKRQEHIIERVVEVKKIEQEEHERNRKKSKTFSEMIEERNKGRHKINIPLFDDDNDLSDYGIASSTSNQGKDSDKEEENRNDFDKKDNNSSNCNNKDNYSTPSQSQSEDETAETTKKVTNEKTNSYKSSLYNNKSNSNSKICLAAKAFENNHNQLNKNETEQYTYEGAIENYRSRIKTKINVDESIFTKNQDPTKSKEFSEAQTVLPKGEIFKRKELFDKSVEINHFESTASRRLSEDFANSQSIKQRLKSLEKCTDQALKSVDKDKVQVISIKERLQNFHKQNEDSRNNNDINKGKPNKISNYLLAHSNSNGSLDAKNKNTEWRKEETSDRSSSPETELYMNKLNMFDRELDTLMYGKSSENCDNMDDCCSNTNYPPSTSSTELMGLSSDREDSGIHTADVSCSVSQADEPVEDSELAASTIPSCIEKLNKEKELQQIKELEETKHEENTKEDYFEAKLENSADFFTKDYIINATTELLLSLKQDASDNLPIFKQEKLIAEPSRKPVIEAFIAKDSKPPIYENVELKPYSQPNSFPVELISENLIFGGDFSLSPAKAVEPPKVKPPPPPPMDDDPGVKRMNSTKRIKKEIHIKRSSFLGLDEPTDDQIDPEIVLDKPPDINSFLQKESKLEKTLYKKVQEDRVGLLSKVESQDSGLDIDRGRLSSDTWCSSTPSHERQDSEQTNSITSEEDEITKKEREIIAMVEKEEKSRDFNGHRDIISNPVPSVNNGLAPYASKITKEKFQNSYFQQPSSDFLDDHDSEVLKVEQELRQLEMEEMERQRDNMLFRESRAKARLRSNRHSLENICDEIYPARPDGVEYRKSMPELQHVPLEYRKSLPDVPNAYDLCNVSQENDLQYRKSMPNIQHAYQKSLPEYRTKSLPPDNDLRLSTVDHRKSMPELQHNVHRSAFKSPPPMNRQPIMPGKPIRPLSTKESKDRYLMVNPVSSDALQPNSKPRQLSRHSLQALSAAPRTRHIPNDNWIQPRANPESKKYNQHWLIQEAELRRIQDQQQKNLIANRNWPQPRSEKHLPDSIIQSLTQRVQNRTSSSERNPQLRRNEASPNKEYLQHTYLNHPQTMGHALPMSYPPTLAIDNQDRVLSVSGKKKCSYCGNELGRGAAMIIESLCLFYHMECFKCCVCHMQLGDGMMGTDVRVRNQKLHCHNCYSSDDGIKFSCV